MVLASLLHVSLQFANTYFMGHDPFPSIYIFSLFLPFSFLLISFTECVSISNQVIVAKKTGEQSLEETPAIALNMMAVGLILTGITALLVFLTGNRLSMFFEVPPQHQTQFIHFSVGMILATAFLIPARVLNGSLRGLGRVGISFVIAAINTLIYFVLLYIFCTLWGWGLDGLIYATIIDGVLFTLSALFVLNRLGHFSFNRQLFAWRHETLLFLGIVGIPIMLSYLLIFGSTFFFNQIVSDFGTAAISGFGIAYRLQTFVILPAIAFGSAIAILMNHRLGAEEPKEAFLICRSGLITVFGVYLSLGFIIYFFRSPLIALFTNDALVIEEGVKFLNSVALTYSWMGVLLSLLVLMEETGDGARAFVLNLTYFVLIVVVGWVLTHRLGDIVWLYRTYAAFNCLGIGVIYRETMRLRRKYNNAGA